MTRNHFVTLDVLLTDEEFSFVNGKLKKFDAVVKPHLKQHSDEFGTFYVEATYSCKQPRKRFFNCPETINLFQYLLKSAGEFSPQLQSKMITEAELPNRIGFLKRYYLRQTQHQATQH